MNISNSFWKQQSIRELERCLNSLSGDLEQVRRPDYSKNTENVANLVREIIHRLRGLLPSGGKIEEMELGRWVQGVRSKFLRLSELVSDLRASDLRQCPPILEWLAEQCLLASRFSDKQRQRYSLVILPNYELNHEYQNLWITLDNIAADLMALMSEEESEKIEAFLAQAPEGKKYRTRAMTGSKSPPLLVAFSLGSLDRKTPLFYPMLGHEVGHLIEFEATSSGQGSLVPILEDLGEEFPLIRGPRTVPGAIERRTFSRKWLRELAADLIGLRLFGPAYLFALSCFLMTFGDESRLLHTGQKGSCYPSAGFRLRVLMDHLERQEEIPESVQQCLQLLAHELPPKDLFFEQTVQDSYSQTTLSPEDKETLERLLDDCEQKISERIPWGTLPSEKELGEMVKAIELGVPPLPPTMPARKQGAERKSDETRGDQDQPDEEEGTESKIHPAAQVLLAGWVYYLKNHLGDGTSPPAPSRKPLELEAISVLIEKSLELICDFTDQESAGLPPALGGDKLQPTEPPPLGVLSGGVLKYCVALPAEERLHIVPLNKSSFQAVSYDLHLGRWFKLARRTQMQQLAIQKKEDRQRILREAYDLFHVHGEGQYGDFVLHPQDFALAVTKEYLLLPRDMMAFIDGKSGLGRTGLSIATAAQIAPGFRGCIVLELFNVGTVPLTLTPGMDIAQLVFQRFTPALQPGDVYSGDFGLTA